MNQINPRKLHHSKWTAVVSINKEKHFLVTKVKFDENGEVELCILEAVLSKRQHEIDWRELKNSDNWQYGWK